MTGIVLSASVRQNLLSLQSTASLLATTQNDLATGNKVNSALDNPTSYFTSAALNNGITSLQSLVSSAQSVANQVLQTPVGYSAKSSVATTAISGANANNLLGTGTGYTDATFAGATATGTITAAFVNVSSTGTVVNNDDLASSVAISSATLLVGTASSTSNDLAAGSITDGSTLVVNGTTITFSTATTSSTGSAASGFTIGIGAGSTASGRALLSDIDAITGSATASSINGGKLVLQTGLTSNLAITGSGNALAGLGLTGGVTATRGGGATSPVALAGTTLLSGT